MISPLLYFAFGLVLDLVPKPVHHVIGIDLLALALPVGLTGLHLVIDIERRIFRLHAHEKVSP